MTTATKTKRIYKRATPQIFLDRLAAGTLRVRAPKSRQRFTADGTPLQPVVEARRWRKTADGKTITPYGRWHRLTLYWAGRSVQYAFVCISANGHRRKIPLHHAVWMAANRIRIPAGCEIHHRHAADRNWPDDLELVSAARNADLARGYPASWDVCDQTPDDF